MTFTRIQISAQLERQLESWHLDEPPSLNYNVTDVLSVCKTEDIERSLKDLTNDLDVSLRFIKNVDVIFARATLKLETTRWLCLGSALLAAAGGIGAALCKREYRKTRTAFASLAILGGGLALLSAYIMSKMHASLLYYQPLFQRRWN
ncbi:MAG: hypothetical protein JSS10_00545 [Verrucomicrobia bacterium]|nr:hypothetical protein [Verrucomicrobiota bacterium]